MKILLKAAFEGGAGKTGKAQKSHKKKVNPARKNLLLPARPGEKWSSAEDHFPKKATLRPAGSRRVPFGQKGNPFEKRTSFFRSSQGYRFFRTPHPHAWVLAHVWIERPAPG